MEINNRQDTIDSRDVIARIEELELEREVEHDSYSNDIEAQEALDAWDDGGEGEELAALKNLTEQCEGYGDWQYGETLIRDYFFEVYAQELAEDMGDINHNVSWPYTHIDWGAAADELRQDYSCVDFDGEEYWLRS